MNYKSFRIYLLTYIVHTYYYTIHQLSNKELFFHNFFYFRRLQDALLQGVYDQEISELHIGDNEKSSSEVKSDEKIEIMNPFKPEDIPKVGKHYMEYLLKIKCIKKGIQSMQM